MAYPWRSQEVTGSKFVSQPKEGVFKVNRASSLKIYFKALSYFPPFGSSKGLEMAYLFCTKMIPEYRNFSS